MNDEKKYSWWSFDDEYITGHQYFVRSIISSLLSIFLIGIYLSCVTAYKRSKSLGHSTLVCKFWSAWGVLVFPLSLTPLFIIVSTFPHWYLWFSNGNKNLINSEKTTYNKDYITDELIKYAGLKRQNLLTEKEFKKLKKKLLDSYK